MRMIRLFLSAMILSGLLLISARGFAWQDLHPDYVRKQVERIADSKTSLQDRRAATWELASVGRAGVAALAKICRTEPRLLWTCVNLLDLIRTDALVVEVFSGLLDGFPGGFKDTGEVRGFVGSRLEDMLGRTFKSDAERRTFVAENARYLVFDPASLRFVLDEEARKRKQVMLHYPYAPSAHAAVDVVFWRLLLALHLGNQQAVESMIGPEVKLVRGGRKTETRPELDLDAFADSPHKHRALLVRDDGKGRWLFRTTHTYFFFEGSPPRCVKAGMKPIE
jgi:hypothetical protein